MANTKQPGSPPRQNAGRRRPQAAKSTQNQPGPTDVSRPPSSRSMTKETDGGVDRSDWTSPDKDATTNIHSGAAASAGIEREREVDAGDEASEDFERIENDDESRPGRRAD